MSSGWVPPVVLAAEECGHVTGHIALSYMQMCARVTGCFASCLYLHF